MLIYEGQPRDQLSSVLATRTLRSTDEKIIFLGGVKYLPKILIQREPK